MGLTLPREGRNFNHFGSTKSWQFCWLPGIWHFHSVWVEMVAMEMAVPKKVEARRYRNDLHMVWW